jgi:hypothetical protein
VDPPPILWNSPSEIAVNSPPRQPPGSTDPPF